MFSSQMNPAGTGRQYNVRLMLDMMSDRCCILVENENHVDFHHASLTLI